MLYSTHENTFDSRDWKRSITSRVAKIHLSLIVLMSGGHEFEEDGDDEQEKVLYIQRSSRKHL